ncbi:hypothetical protein J6590_006687 [Homalodisca vitripennis]|nr:hypothetical protein J6590_006687 [Homalodisca vitripennis]
METIHRTRVAKTSDGLMKLSLQPMNYCPTEEGGRNTVEGLQGEVTNGSVTGWKGEGIILTEQMLLFNTDFSAECQLPRPQNLKKVKRWMPILKALYGSISAQCDNTFPFEIKNRVE